MDLMEQVQNAINGNTIATEQKTAENALTLGLGFHKFDGKVSVKEVMQQIGADFNVSKEHLVRIPNDIYEELTKNGSTLCALNLSNLITSHCATVNTRDNNTLGIVGSDYGVIQNADGLNILDLVTNSSVDGMDMRIVSAGLVHNSDPYVQVEMPMMTNELNRQVTHDNSPHKFYAFFHTSHDGSSGLKVSFSVVRVVCANTFAANMRESNGFNVKHTKNAAIRVDLSKEANIQRIKEIVTKFNLFSSEYIERMNKMAQIKIDDKFINEFCTKLFINDEKMQDLARQYNYNFASSMLDLPTRTKNTIKAFKDNLESGIGQDATRGTRAWLWNGFTSYFSNVAPFGNKQEAESSRNAKRFDSLMNGSSQRKLNLAYEMLAA